MDYRKEKKILYPNLYDAAVQLLSISTGSCDVERSFSLMRNVQQPNQSCMSEKTLCMELTIYYNKDLDQSFDFL
uniref:HAT C-terminal dimerisation domain-containing protein n=1 Tax=Amphimedon queenslandica TaxID=400682 RepID=A0A1X7V8L2_AMPQE